MKFRIFTKKWQVYFITLLLFTALIGLFVYQSRPKPKPLLTFNAPFVFGQFKVPAENPLTEESVLLGRHLFYDPILSGNNKISCSTCHQQQFAFSDGRRVSLGISQKPLEFNAMSLANLLWGPQRFFWDGRSDSLEAQALDPLRNHDEMHQDFDELLIELENSDLYPALFQNAYGEISMQALAKALASFQRTLVTANSKYDQYLRGEVSLSPLEEKGRKLFMAHPDAKASLRGGNCIDCHSQFLTSGFKQGWDGFSNNGLDDDETLRAGLSFTTGSAQHKGLFKAPTLRNIAITAPYMHDGRFNTLEEVLQHYDSGIKNSKTLSPLIREASNIAGAADMQIMDHHSQISLHLSEEEIAAIIAFLHTLTDESFLNNPEFSNPFEKAPPHEKTK